MILQRLFRRNQPANRKSRRLRTFCPRLGDILLEGRVVLSTTPYKIPLELVNIRTAANPEYKLGIYVGLGGGAPKLYEFDTGGKGFWAAYSPKVGANQWWGKATVEETGTLSNSYASGNNYQANLVSTTVELYGADGHGPASSPVVQTGQVELAQIQKFYNSKNANAAKSWTSALKHDRAPLFGHFYGDFGASLAPVASSQGTSIFSILPQIPMPAGLDVGFIVHVGSLDGSTKPWLQVGIDPTDTASYTQVPMNPYASATAFPVTGVPAYSEHVATATFELHDKKTGLKQTFSQIGWTIDTGAPTATIWQAPSKNDPNAVIVKKGFLKKEHPKQIRDHVELHITANNAIAGQPNLATGFEVGKTPPKSKLGAGRHSTAGATGWNYVNTGLWTFTQFDVAFDLSRGTVGFSTVNTAQAG